MCELGAGRLRTWLGQRVGASSRSLAGLAQGWRQGLVLRWVRLVGLGELRRSRVALAGTIVEAKCWALR